MKKVRILFLLCFFILMAGCTQNEEATTEEIIIEDFTSEAEGVMSYEEFKKLPAGAPVVIHVTVKEKKEWKDYKASLIGTDKEGTYYLEEVICSEDAFDNLSIGATILVTGYKADETGTKIIEASFEVIER